MQNNNSDIRMKEIYFYYTLYTYFSTQSPFTATNFFQSFYPFFHSVYEESFWLAADSFAHSCLSFGIRWKMLTFNLLAPEFYI
jgi:hypothetical protein